MPLPLIIGGIAAVAGVAGVGTGIHGGIKMKEASDTMKLAQSKQERAIALFNSRNDETTALMDAIGTQELEILSTFDDFSDIIEKIQGRPEFKAYKREGIDLPEYEAEELKKISAGAGVLLGGIGGAAAGTAGGFAAAGATTSAVMALGTASTGTAISALSGAAATNATLAALGGGAVAYGGGGMALGTAVLGGATLGVGLLVGGIIFNVTGSKLSDKADEAYVQGVINKCSNKTGAFKGYAISVTDIKNLDLNWKGEDLFVQNTSVEQDYGVFDSPDVFFKEHKQTWNKVKDFAYVHYGRKVMNRNVFKIRQSAD